MPLRKLYKHLQEIYHWNSTNALLSWDTETYMPPQNIHFRIQQIELITQLIHHKKTSELQKVMDEINTTDLPPNLLAIYSKVKEDLDRWQKIPATLASQIAAKSAECQFQWEKAKKNNDFAAFAPCLVNLIKLKQEEARAVGYQKEPYEALLNDYEKGLTPDQFQQILQPVIQTFFQKSTPLPSHPNPFQVFIPKQKQLEFANFIAKTLGFDFDRGRQDLAAHPFANGITHNDVRITTRIDENNLLYMLYSTIHEIGHALYEQGLDPTNYGTPLSETCSLAIHESQARLWENNIGRSMPFAELLSQLLKDYFPDIFHEITPIAIFDTLNQVKPSFIRTEADEVTYHLHIALRFELERELINGSIAVNDLPALWNEKMQNYLGITPPSDALGVLQDVHWAAGLFGYFPTYSLGSFIAAQLYHTLQIQFKDLSSHIKNANFSLIHQWLKQNIFDKGRMANSNEITLMATQQPLTTQPFIQYIQQKIPSLSYA